jgi:hypothetical protein
MWDEHPADRIKASKQTIDEACEQLCVSASRGMQAARRKTQGLRLSSAYATGWALSLCIRRAGMQRVTPAGQRVFDFGVGATSWKVGQ